MAAVVAVRVVADTARVAVVVAAIVAVVAVAWIDIALVWIAVVAVDVAADHHPVPPNEYLDVLIGANKQDVKT